ncbi:sigma-54-dependent transcriptional regulator [Deferribacter abyssi]|uniref:sigma-54-dependent transcriptional regulator n=1 Tax=Deferribacter abyssi TaxID=213806 RepID=UPI003C2A6377
MYRIAIVDDEVNFVKFLAKNLKNEGFIVDIFFDGSSFLRYLENYDPDVVLLDLGLPDCHGLNLYPKILKSNNLTQVIVITAHGNLDTAVEAIKMGCYDYVNKPFGLDEIILIIKRGLERKKILEELSFRRNKEYESVEIDSLIGSSAKMNDLKKLLKMVADADDVTVLIQGESGTGKNLFARLIHNLSKRRENPFIEVNCASIPDNLIESELFGFEKGAFTDAKGNKKGLVELADKGTLLLDEVAEIPIDMQAKLLSFLENKTFRRVGGVKEFKIDVRVIASTNRDLEQLVRDKDFREDLYYRLNVINIKIPPLRERKEDILELANFFLAQYTKKYNKKLIFDEEVVSILEKYQWPGNIRELKNLIERAVILSNEPVITTEHFVVKCDENIQWNYSSDRKGVLEINKIEKEMIMRALEESGFVKTKAAEKLGISRYALLRKMKKYKLL